MVGIKFCQRFETFKKCKTFVITELGEFFVSNLVWRDFFRGIECLNFVTFDPILCLGRHSPVGLQLERHCAGHTALTKMICCQSFEKLMFDVPSDVHLGMELPHGCLKIYFHCGSFFKTFVTFNNLMDFFLPSFPLILNDCRPKYFSSKNPVTSACFWRFSQANW